MKYFIILAISQTILILAKPTSLKANDDMKIVPLASPMTAQPAFIDGDIYVDINNQEYNGEDCYDENIESFEMEDAAALSANDLRLEVGIEEENMDYRGLKNKKLLKVVRVKFQTLKNTQKLLKLTPFSP